MPKSVGAVDSIVVGAGVVGLAIARRLAQHGREVLVLEKADTVGSGISSRNSEVIHAGLYYPKDSLKARLCVQGRHLLYAYAQSRQIPCRRFGKLVVANDEQEVLQLQTIFKRARDNGVNDAELITAEDARRLEPDLSCLAAMLSPSTGVIDSHSYIVSLEREAVEAGASLALQSTVHRADFANDGKSSLYVQSHGAEMYLIKAKHVINSAGLGAPGLARAFNGLPDTFKPKNDYLAKGNYFSSLQRPPFTHLIYPVPQTNGGLGVHLTLDLNGQARFGPDLEWVHTENYDVDPARAESFYAAVRRYWPALADDALVPDYAGIRPKIVRPGGDFCIQHYSHPGKRHNSPSYLGLLAIESPGLTASLSIAEYVKALMDHSPS